MRVSDARRVLFVHIPKTGGSTIDWIFDNEVPDSRRVKGSKRHATYQRIVNRQPEIADYWSAGFVRNPWARMVSWWSMGNDVLARADAGKPHALRNVHGHPHVWEPFARYRGDFRAFVLDGTRTVERFGRPQLEWLTLRNGRSTDFIGRVESFIDDVNTVRERLGLEPMPEQPRRNQSEHAHYSDYYDDETRQRVGEVFARDIEAFGYSFDDRSGSRQPA
jgi:Sulfotransferase family